MAPNPRKKALLLLMSETDAEFFARVIKSASDDVAALRMKSIKELDQFTRQANTDMRLIAFCSGDIVPASIIKRLDGNCLNFHPGPPERPGYMPAPFALRDGSKDYGVTFHMIKPKVDTGAIIEVSRFPVPEERTQETLELAAYEALLKMVVSRRNELVDLSHQFSPSGDQWSGYKTTRKDLAALQAEKATQ